MFMVRRKIKKKEQILRNMIKASLIMFIALMLVLSTFLIIADMTPNNPDASYNGIRFNYNANEGIFLFQMNNQQIRTHAHPIDAQVHRLSPETTNLLRNSVRIGISESTNNASEWEPLAAFTVAEALRRGNNVNIVRGYSDSEPFLDCSLANQNYPIIELKRAEENNLVELENCIRIEYVDESFLFVVKDSVIYHALGVIIPTG